MSIIIQALGYLTVIGGILIGVFLYYNLQTQAVWTTFATIIFAGLAFCLSWRKQIFTKKNRETKKGEYRVWVSFAVITILGLVFCSLWQKSIWSKVPQGDDVKIPKEISLKKFYENDFDNLLRANEDRIIKSQDGTEVTINSKIYFDFESNSKFLGFYIPSTPITFEICVHLLDFYKIALERGDGNLVEWSQTGLQPVTNRELEFSGRIFIYHESPLFAAEKRKLYSIYESRKISLQFRGHEYAFEKSINNTLSG